MLAVTEPLSARGPLSSPVDVAILSVATAVPENKVTQQEMAERAKVISPQFSQFDSLYVNTGIEHRYACETRDWYLAAHSWAERSETWYRHALDLLERAARDAVAAAGLAIRDIDAVVVNTITGIAVPSLDARLFNRVEFRADAERLPIFGFGCGGGVAGMSRAARLARSMPGANVLFMTVDLCSLCLRIDDPSIEMFVSAALFGDGAVAVVLRREPEGAEALSAGRPRVVVSGEHLWRDTERIMGWDMKPDGFGVVLSPQLPFLMRDELGGALAAFLGKHGLSVKDFAGFLFHPGGRKVLETAQSVLGLTQHDLRHSWNVLRDYGNMSSATALFILSEAIRSGAKGRHLLTAFGPGFAAYFAILEL